MLGCKCSVAEGRHLYSNASNQNCCYIYKMKMFKSICWRKAKGFSKSRCQNHKIINNQFLPKLWLERVLNWVNNCWKRGRCARSFLALTTHTFYKSNKSNKNKNKNETDIKLGEIHVIIWTNVFSRKRGRGAGSLLALTFHTKTSIFKIPSTGSHFFQRSNYIPNGIKA